jgi:hypothetical protein
MRRVRAMIVTFILSRVRDENGLEDNATDNDDKIFALKIFPR